MMMGMMSWFLISCDWWYNQGITIQGLKSGGRTKLQSRCNLADKSIFSVVFHPLPAPPPAPTWMVAAAVEYWVAPEFETAGLWLQQALRFYVCCLPNGEKELVREDFKEYLRPPPNFFPWVLIPFHEVSFIRWLAALILQWKMTSNLVVLG